MFDSLFNFCYECLFILGSFSRGWMIYYIITLLCFGAIYKKNYIYLEEHKHQINPDFGNLLSMKKIINIYYMSNMLFSKIARMINLNLYIKITSILANFLKNITGVKEKNSLAIVSKNIWTFFIFYYVIVFTPAIIMIPYNYDAPVYGGVQSIIALLLMMLTNAIGDLVSIKITLKNIKKIHTYHKNIKPRESNNLIMEELKIYSIAIIDILLALFVLTSVLVLTSVYFGVSIGEYKFEFSQQFLEGAIHRVKVFYETVMEPYVFRDVFYSESNIQLPMLFLFSLTGFLPSALILLLCFFCIFSLPFRVIYNVNMRKTTAIIIPQLIVFLYCLIGLISYTKINEIFNNNFHI